MKYLTFPVIAFGIVFFNAALVNAQQTSAETKKISFDAEAKINGLEAKLENLKTRLDKAESDKLMLINQGLKNEQEMQEKVDEKIGYFFGLLEKMIYILSAFFIAITAITSVLLFFFNKKYLKSQVRETYENEINSLIKNEINNLIEQDEFRANLNQLIEAKSFENKLIKSYKLALVGFDDEDKIPKLLREKGFTISNKVLENSDNSDAIIYKGIPQSDDERKLIELVQSKPVLISASGLVTNQELQNANLLSIANRKSQLWGNLMSLLTYHEKTST